MAVINGPKTCNLFLPTCNLAASKTILHRIAPNSAINKTQIEGGQSEVANTGLTLLTGALAKNQILDTSEISATIWSILKILISDSHGAGILNRLLQSTFYTTCLLCLYLYTHFFIFGWQKYKIHPGNKFVHCYKQTQDQQTTFENRVWSKWEICVKNWWTCVFCCE